MRGIQVSLPDECWLLFCLFRSITGVDCAVGGWCETAPAAPLPPAAAEVDGVEVRSKLERSSPKF